METIQASKEDSTILMELMQYYGKDVNLVDLYKMFKTIHEKAGYDDQFPSKEDFESKISENFNIAIGELKYMGFISATKQSTFLFKKNVFGKPKYYSTNIGTN